MSFKHQFSIIIPVYNERENVQGLFEEIINVLDSSKFNFEIIFVNDGSTDGTREILKDLSLTHQSVLKVISHNKNYGQSAALLTGARFAQFPVLITMDGDGQNDPADILKLLENFNNNVVLGIRKKRNDNVIKRISSLIGNSVRQKILNDECKDTGCSLKIFSKLAFLELPYFNHMHRFLPALFKRSGYNLITVEVNHRPRCHGVSKYGIMNRLFVSIYDLIGMRWLLKRSCFPEVLNEQS